MKVYPDVNPPYFSYIYAGLLELSHKKKIRLKFAGPLERLGSRLNPSRFVMRLQSKNIETSVQKDIYIDLSDGKGIEPGKVENCDVYFKRSYSEAYISGLRPDVQERVRPFGLCYACKSPHESIGFYRILSYYLTHFIAIRDPFQTLQNTAKIVELIVQDHNRPTFEDFEGDPEQPASPTILFRTRVWAPNSTKDRNRELVNEMRLSTLKALRSEFGNSVCGGLIPDRYTLEEYPEYVSMKKANRRDFINKSLGHLIGVYTAGLHESTSWKLGEFLADAKCIAAEPKISKLPANLKEGVNYLPFTTPEQCVEVCKRILNDSDLASEMRHNNYNYYLEEVKPEIRILKTLEAAFD